jgi:hypothetical protein
MGILSKATKWVGERTGLKKPVDYVLQKGGEIINPIIPKEIKPVLTEPVELLFGGRSLGEMNILPKEVKNVLPKEVRSLSGPELAALAAAAAYGGSALLGAGGAAGGAGGSGSLLSLFGPGNSMWFGSSGLPSSLSSLTSIGLTPGALTSGTGGLAVNLPGAAAGGGGWLSSLSSAWPAMLGGSGTGLSSWILPTLGIGLGADLLSGYNQAKLEKQSKEALGQASDRYLAETTWNPQRRAEYMKGVQSELQSMLAGRERRIGEDMAARGIGGGEYGRQLDNAYSDAMGTAVKMLYGTYEPSNVSPEVLKAWATSASPTKSGGWRFLDSLSNLAGSAGSQMLNWMLLKNILQTA